MIKAKPYSHGNLQGEWAFTYKIDGVRARRTIYLTVGAPRSGKTTWANSMVKKGALTLSLDGLRHALYSSKRTYWDDATEETRGLLFDAYRSTARWLLESTTADIVVPNCNLKDKYYQEVLRWACVYECDLEVHVFHCGLKTLLRRNELSDVQDNMPEGELRLYYKLFKDPEAYWRTLPNVIHHRTRKGAAA